MSRRNPRTIKHALNQKYYKKAVSKSNQRKITQNSTNQGGLPNLAQSQGVMSHETGPYGENNVQQIGQLLQNNGVASGNAVGLSLEQSSRGM